jgi:hypothetical protein
MHGTVLVAVDPQPGASAGTNPAQGRMCDATLRNYAETASTRSALTLDQLAGDHAFAVSLAARSSWRKLVINGPIW